MLAIRTVPDPVLRTPTTPVTEFGASLRTLAEQMRQTMHAHRGMGLAAPQIGQSISLAVIEYDGSESDSPIPFTVIINPTITRQSINTVVMEEGCISIPGFEGEVRRSKWVTIAALNLEGKPQTIKAKGLYARVLQHEIDHLNGILYTDKLEPGTILRPDS